MSVLIKGMEMPDCGYVCLKVFANGEVLMTKVCRGGLVITGIKDKVGTAVPVPPHGRLIDADSLEAELWKMRAQYQMLDDTQTADQMMHGLYRAEQLLKGASTIIEAEEADE